MRDGYVSHTTWCPVHEKKAFSKKAAKRAIRHMHDAGMREYRCDRDTGLWHVGHLPLAVMEGQKTAADVYGARP